jgi:acyl carrier protein
MAQTTGLGYYTQSILNRENLKPELLILGINPGEFRESITITGSELLQGNPCFKGMDDKEILYELSEKPDKKKRRYGWDLWKKVFKLLNYSQKGEILRDLDRFVISNMIFFGTENEGQIPREIDSNKCAQQTLKLIDILKGIRPNINVESASLVDDGELDSFDIVTLVSEIIDAFNVELNVDDIVPENFNSVEAMYKLIESRK